MPKSFEFAKLASVSLTMQKEEEDLLREFPPQRSYQRANEFFLPRILTL